MPVPAASNYQQAALVKCKLPNTPVDLKDFLTAVTFVQQTNPRSKPPQATPSFFCKLEDEVVY